MYNIEHNVAMAREKKTKKSSQLSSIMTVLLTIVSLTVSNGQYIPPQATVLPLYPKGLRVSIPDEPGISLMAFHGKINEDFQGLEAGSMARDIVKVRDGRWTFEDRGIKLRKGDTIYYWLHVVYEGLGYNLLDQSHHVTDFYNYDGSLAITGDETGPCRPSITKLVGTGGERATCAGQLLFEDQFDNLNATRWRKNELMAGAPDYEFVVYLDSEENVKVENGQLRITPTLMEMKYGKQFVRRGNLNLERCTGRSGSSECQRQAQGSYILPPILSGRIDTKDSFAFLYGRIEIRAKLPRGDWIYPLLSLEPLESIYGSDYDSGQLRVACAAGNTVLRSSKGTDLSGRILTGGPIISRVGSDGRNTVSSKSSALLWADDYHVYEIEWQVDRVVLKVDGAQYGSNEFRSLGKNLSGPFDRPFYLNIAVAVGGHGEFPDNCTSNGYAKPWRNVGSKALFNFFNATELWSKTWKHDATSLKVDYIKVWAL